MFSLRYKFSLIVVILLFFTLGSAFWLIRGALNDVLEQQLAQHFSQAQEQFSELVQQPVKALYNIASYTRTHPWITDALYAKALTPGSQVYKNLRKALPNEAILLNPLGQILEAGEGIRSWAPELNKQCVENKVSFDKERLHLLMLSDIPVQVLVVPISDHQNEGKIIGTLLLAHLFDETYLNHLRKLLGVDILLLDAQEITLTSGLFSALSQRPLLNQLQIHLQSRTPIQLKQQYLKLQQVQLSNRLWHYIQTTQKASVPAHLFIQPLDDHQGFVARIQNNLLMLGGLLLILSFLMIRPLFRQVTAAVQMLHTATDQIEKENYQFRARIRTYDELESLGHAFNQMMHSLEGKEHVRQAMEHLVSPELVMDILKKRLSGEGQTRIASVLVVGIQDFSRHTAGRSAQDLLSWLNNYFTRMQFCIAGQEGFVDAYSGDKLTAAFGITGNSSEPHTGIYAAVLAAKEMLNALTLFNLEVISPQISSTQHGFGNYQQNTINIGIGIDTNSLIAGKIGAENRQHYSIIGSPIKRAQQLEKLTRHYGVSILISQSAWDALKTEIPAKDYPLHRELDCIDLDSEAKPLNIYEILPACDERENIKDLLQRYQQARIELQQNHFKKAENLFQQLHDDWPEDKPTRLLLGRSRRYHNNIEKYTQENPQGAYRFLTQQSSS
ncbi:adenylate/guanylate cyclase domain-containing protein [Candidatus Venteria ishoeyi]|uniref:Adenylate cyclase 1 n=1 Tax=Candidatus Venteria ishoeyi TaxID=1899563 RepID=A0A1H6FDD9_9GAMM|nr:adenylate/guanylate cyclase domain-containing protein [Candidatus Venteria ishoeyi]MDM8545533.1 adenylate/guanylate cyclase domain-containing protein [Candidatus Venteria ishoeyi]SEH07035.1 Adenylate cyclase 1 [Candidatus Venteria ishoeyi]